MDEERFGTTADYLRAFKAVFAKSTLPKVREMLRTHLAAPGSAMTWDQLAERVGYAAPKGAHLQYGIFSRKVAEQLECTEEFREADWVWVLAWFPQRDPKTQAVVVALRQPVVEALQQLEVVEALRQLERDERAASGLLPGEFEADPPIREGAWKLVQVNAYERNPQARERCLAAHGATCCICQFSFGAVYCPEAEKCIHVHHVKPLSEAGGEYEVDPVKDLLPVCPNCHAVLHLGGGGRSVEEVQQLLTRQRRASRRNRKWS